ncbi:MAG: type II toxin-antitoxin system Phd/YefM family antitoxin [Parachlamydia sp.]|nr:type II toxin-antitoxin system Phd/YefM family antitoxin [Parachlamydia sp.]
MAMKKWKLQDAKNHFSELVECAMNDGPQEVTKRGEPAVVILSFAKYQQLSKPKGNLVDFFRNSPLYGVELDLERKEDYPREIEF